MNRVTGDQPTDLLGKVHSPGPVYLINPNGIVIGQNGVIDVANFVGTTFDISDTSFLAGVDLNFSGDSTSSLKNEGTIQANGENILLFAHHVVNKGSLTAKEGDAQLGAGHDLLLAVEGKEYLLVKPNLPGKGIHNGGKIEALRAVLSCHSNPYELGIQNSGVIEANRVEEVNGEIYIVAKDSCFINRTIMRAPRGKIQFEIENGKSINFDLIESLGGEVTSHSTSKALEKSDQICFFNYGKINVTGSEVVKINMCGCDGGKIDISYPKFSNTGSLIAEGHKGEIKIISLGTYIEEKGLLSVNGANGFIQIQACTYFTSGTFDSHGNYGGNIKIEEEKLNFLGSQMNASGKIVGGKIQLKSTSLQTPLRANSSTLFNASGVNQGGTLELISPIPILSEVSIDVTGPGGPLIESSP